MKIAVFGHPRSGSTKMSVLLCLMFRVKFWQELLNTTLDVDELMLLVDKINTTPESFVVKLFAHNFNIVPLDSIRWNSFDLIVTTTRESIVDTYISYYIAGKRNNWIKFIRASWETGTFIVDVNLIKRTDLIIASHIMLPQSIAAIKLLSPTTKIVELTYNEILDNNSLRTILPDLIGLPQEVVNWELERFTNNGMLPTGINYREKCLNYDEVELKFKELGII